MKDKNFILDQFRKAVERTIPIPSAAKVMFEQKVSNITESEFDKILEFINALKFPLTLYRGLRLKRIEDFDEEDIGVNWTVDLNLFKNYSSFQDVNYIVKGQIDEDSIDYPETIQNYIYYSLRLKDQTGKHPENEVTIKTDAKIDNLEIFERKDILEGVNMREEFNLNDAFKALNSLEESEQFNINADKDLERLSNLFKRNRLDPIDQIIDLEAEEEKDLKDSYIGSVIVQCPICGSKIYYDPENIQAEEDAEGELYCKDSEFCPECNCETYYKIIGKVVPFMEEKADKEVEDDLGLDSEAEEKKEDLIQESSDVLASISDKDNDKWDIIKEEDGTYSIIDPESGDIEEEGFENLDDAINAAKSKKSVVESLAESLENSLLYKDNTMKLLRESVDMSGDQLSTDLPEMCYVPTYTDGIAVVQKGELGYYSTDIAQSNGLSLDDESGIQELVDKLNSNLGVSKKQARAMKNGSMFGWHVPAANPENIKEDFDANNSDSEIIEYIKGMPSFGSWEDRVADLVDTFGISEDDAVAFLEKNIYSYNSIEDLDESKFDIIINSYLAENFNDVKSYKTTDGSINNNKIVLEGIVEFNDGSSFNTTSTLNLKENIIECINEKLFEKALSIRYSIDNKNVICQSLEEACDACEHGCDTCPCHDKDKDQSDDTSDCCNCEGQEVKESLTPEQEEKLDDIAKELNISEDEAKQLMKDKLGFTEEDFNKNAK